MPTETRSTPVLLFVLGMHRSGTSALTRTLNLLGATLPGHLMPADPESNAAGFWESIDIASLNDRLLREFGRTWDDVRETPDWPLPAVELARYRTMAREILERDFGVGGGLGVVKDPRICRLVPFWKGVAEEAGYQTRFVLAVRHPKEVAASLAARDGLGSKRSEQLWQRYLLDAEFSTRDAVRTVVCFDTLMSDWKSVAVNTARELGIQWPISPEAADEAVGGFLSSRLRNHHDRAAGATAAATGRLYEYFQRSEGDIEKLAPERMDESGKQLDLEVAADRPLIDEYQQSLLRCRLEVVRRLDEMEKLRDGRSALAEWARELSTSLELARAEQVHVLEWVLESLLAGLGGEVGSEGDDEAGPGLAFSPDPALSLGDQIGAGLEATHRWREEARRRILEGEEALAQARQAQSAARENLERAVAEKTELERAVAEGQERMNVLRDDLERATAEKLESIEALAIRDAALDELKHRFDELSSHAERLEAKVDFVRRIPLAGWLWRSFG